MPKLFTIMFYELIAMRKSIFAAWLILNCFFGSFATAQDRVDVEELKENYSLQGHSEGGYLLKFIPRLSSIRDE